MGEFPKNYEILNLLSKEERVTLEGLLLGAGQGLAVYSTVTIGLAQLCYDAFGVIYDFKTKSFCREEKVRIVTREELEKELDKYL